MNQAQKNFIIGIIHEGLWGAGFGFFLPTTILPLALVALGQSASIVGLMAALFLGSLTFPQVFSALALPPRFTNPKTVAWLHTPILSGVLLAGLGFAWLPVGAQTARVLFLFAGFTLYSFATGVVIPHWVAMIGRCIPENRQGRYFGTSFFANGLCASGTSLLASRWAVLGGMHWGYTLCFLVPVPFLVLSVLMLSRLKPLLPPPHKLPKGAFWKSFELMNHKLFEPGPFRIGLVLTVLMVLVSAPGNLFTAYLAKEVMVNADWFQLFSPATALGAMVGAFLMGLVVDHKGLKPAFILAFAAGTASLGLIFLWGNPFWPSLAFAGNGFIGAAFPVVTLVMILKLAGHQESTVQQGLFATMMSPWNVGAPFFCGWVSEKAGYPWAFGLAALCGLVAFGILIKFGGLDGRRKRD